MKIGIYRCTVLTVLFTLSIIIVIILPCTNVVSAQTNNGLKITHEVYGWTSDMKRLAMTTQDTPLIFKLTIENTGQKTIEIGYPNNNIVPNPFQEFGCLYIKIDVDNIESSRNYNHQKEIIFNSDNPLYLPSGEKYSRLIEFDQYGSEMPIGSYSAMLAYSTYAPISSNNGGSPIEPYPFNFKIASPEALQEAIKNDSGAFISIGDIKITLFEFSIGSTITIVSAGVIVYLWKSKK